MGDSESAVKDFLPSCFNKKLKLFFLFVKKHDNRTPSQSCNLIFLYKLDLNSPLKSKQAVRKQYERRLLSEILKLKWENRPS